jgi:hypothetical protein
MAESEMRNAQGGIFELRESMTIELLILPPSDDFGRAQPGQAGRKKRQAKWFGDCRDAGMSVHREQNPSCHHDQNKRLFSRVFHDACSLGDYHSNHVDERYFPLRRRIISAAPRPATPVASNAKLNGSGTGAAVA